MAIQQPEQVEAVVLCGGGHHLPHKSRQNVRGWRWKDWPTEQ
jgi:hypothetical protein